LSIAITIKYIKKAKNNIKEEIIEGIIIGEVLSQKTKFSVVKALNI